MPPPKKYKVTYTASYETDILSYPVNRKIDAIYQTYNTFKEDVRFCRVVIEVKEVK